MTSTPHASTPNPAYPSTGPVPNLRHVPTGELCRRGNARVTEVITLKIQSLDSRNLVERDLTAKARMLLELLRDTLTGRYPHLSVAAFAEVLLAMHTFIEVYDTIPDTWTHGYEDDLRRIDRVLRDYRQEIVRYQEWRQQGPGAPDRFGHVG